MIIKIQSSIAFRPPFSASEGRKKRTVSLAATKMLMDQMTTCFQMLIEDTLNAAVQIGL